MHGFSRFIVAWSKISVAGIIIIMIVIGGFVIADVFFDKNYGYNYNYNYNDIYIVGTIIGMSILLYIIVRGLVSRIYRQ